MYHNYMKYEIHINTIEFHGPEYLALLVNVLQIQKFASRFWNKSCGLLTSQSYIMTYRITHYVAVAYINRRLLWQPVTHMHPWRFIANILSDCPSMGLDQKSDATTCIASK